MVLVPDGLHAKTISIPVRVVGGKLESYYGGPLPALKDGAIGDLVVPEHAVRQEEVVRRLQAEYMVEFLPAGATVFIAVDLNRVPQHLRKLVAQPERQASEKYRTFVPVMLDESLQLLLRGDKQAILRNCRCHFSAGKDFPAKSLNHACTLVSEVFEPGRTSRGGNVFRLGHIVDTGGQWLPLDDLRGFYQGQLEQYLALVSMWAQLAPDEPERRSTPYQVTLLVGSLEAPGGPEETNGALRTYLQRKGPQIARIVEGHRSALSRLVAGLDLDDQGRPCDRRLSSALAWLAELLGGDPADIGRDVVSAMIELLVAVKSLPNRKPDLVDRDRLLKTMEPILFDILEECRPEFAPPSPVGG